MGVLVFNPSLKDNHGTLNSNLGDLIIIEAIMAEMSRAFPGEEVDSISSHAQPGDVEIIKIRRARHRIVGGTNVLSSDMRHCRQWAMPGTTLALHPAILCGVGWQHYQSSVKFFTKVLLKLALSRSFVHSVRDGYTKMKLRSCGIWNVVNTSCPTLWPLAGQRKVVNAQKPARSVLLMLTDYRKDIEADTQLLACLRAQYKTIYFWPQGEMDLSYLLEITGSRDAKLVVLERTLGALDAFLAATPDLDYVGTRLHGGVRCLLAGKRSLILEVDNRAAEIAKETGLPALSRTEMGNIKKWVATGWQNEVWVDDEPIKKWRDQFAA